MMRWLSEITQKIAEHGATVFLAVVTGALSFSHIRDLALRAGQGQWQADLYPVAVDAVTVYALRKVLDRTLSGGVRMLAWFVFALFCGISLAANLFDAPVHDLVGYFVAVLPSAAFVVNTLLSHFSAHREEPEVKPATKTKPARAKGATKPRSAVRQELEKLAVAYAANPNATGVAFARQIAAPWLTERGLERSEGSLRNIYRQATA